MRSQLAERLGVQEPQILHLPPDVHSLAAAEEAIELADAYGVCSGFPLAESQRITLRAGLGERVDGSWAAATVGDFKPRQGGGKTDTIAARELAGLLLFGEQLQIHTAHEFPTANESFLRLVALFENWDDLRRRVDRIRYANGEQGIELLTGQRLKYRARTGGSGRGFAKADLVVYDEAQNLQAEHVAASGPARLANPNSQSWYAGSGGFTHSKMAWALRRRALAGDAGRLAYCENTAEVVSLVDGKVVSVRPDVEDRDGWAAANCGMNRWVTEEALADLLSELGPELFARECECVWDPEPSTSGDAIPIAAFLDCIVDANRPAGPLRYALDVAPGARAASIAMSDGRHLEVVKHASGVDWVVAACVAKSKDIGELVVDPSGPAGELIAPLEAAGVAVEQVSTREAIQACGGFLTAVVNRQMAVPQHPHLEALTHAVQNADRRDVGDGGWLWSRRKSSVDISPLYAVTLARWAAGLATADPKPVFAY